MGLARNLADSVVAPNANFGNSTSATNPPPVAITAIDTGALGISSPYLQYALDLESQNIYYACGATCYAWATGWQDVI
jgi:hypothetical protein